MTQGFVAAWMAIAVGWLAFGWALENAPADPLPSGYEFSQRW